MAGESDKQVRLSFTVDTASVGVAKRAIGELITAAQELVHVMAQANLGGLSSSTSTSSYSIAPGSSGTGPPAAAQSPVQRVAGSVTSDAKAMKDVAQAATTTVKGLTDAVATSAREQGRSIEDLKRKLEGLRDMYGRVAASLSGGGDMDDFLSGGGRSAGG